MDASTADLVFKWVNFGVTVSVGLYVWLTNRNRVTHARITELQEKTGKSLKELRDDSHASLYRIEHDVESRLDTYGTQLARLEEAMKHMPSMDELRQIHLRINAVSELCTQLRGELGGVNNLLHTIHEYLLKGDKK